MYMREWRENPINRWKEEARTRARKALRQGIIKKKACFDCGDPNTQMHHPDYGDPLDVVWLCRRHHELIHKIKRASPLRSNEAREETPQSLEVRVSLSQDTSGQIDHGFDHVALDPDNR